MNGIYILAKCFWILLIPSVLCKVGFVKDQKTNQEFPPRILKTFDSGIPVGHMRPLGWQKRPEGRVAQEKQMITPKDFYEKYVSIKKPVTIRNALKDVPAMTEWSKDSTLREKYGDLDVHVVVKNELFSHGPKKVKFRKFLKEYNYEDWYLSNVVPQEMMNELLLPKCLKCGMHRFLQEPEVWMSSGGTASLLHSHADHNLHCVLAGRKDFILIDRKHRQKLEYEDNDDHPGAGHTKLDMDRINMFNHPKVAEVPWIWSTLQGGDCVFVPAGYLHQVRSYGRSISSTTLWAPSPDVDFSDCKESTLDVPTPLSDATFIWTYMNADRQLSNARLNAKSLQHHLLVLMREEKNLTFHQFADFYDEIMSETDEHIECKRVWQILDTKGEKKLSREDIKLLDKSILDEVANILNKPHIDSKPGRDEL